METEASSPMGFPDVIDNKKIEKDERKKDR